ncbi:hypothetical protein TRVL_02450 [Trypanosoma vivax]|nr:hypothetical protein TRVL_02450 [Trypanosoma vivax]
MLRKLTVLVSCTNCQPGPHVGFRSLIFPHRLSLFVLSNEISPSDAFFFPPFSCGEVCPFWKPFVTRHVGLNVHLCCPRSSLHAPASETAACYSALPVAQTIASLALNIDESLHYRFCAVSFSLWVAVSSAHSAFISQISLPPSRAPQR